MDAVRSRLSDIRGLEATGLSSQAEQIKAQLDIVSSFPLMAVQEDPSMLEYAARDFAFSLAQIYISEPFTNLVNLLATLVGMVSSKSTMSYF